MIGVSMQTNTHGSHGPSDKERKYDRQLRLWAASGQDALESAHILLINSACGTVGIETLKNLVLPGIGRFTIVDDAVVSDVDLGINFFLDESCLGLPRAECCAERLLELNPDVEGDWYPKKPKPRPAVASNGSKKVCLAGADQAPVDLPSILNGPSSFTVILYTLPIREKDLALIEAYGKAHSTPVVSVHSAGFFSYFQVSLPDVLPIVDTHPDDAATMDLRLVNPWKELVDFCTELTKDIDDLDNHEHGHLPFVAILAHYLGAWKEEHGRPPSTYPEKVAFRKAVSEGMRRDNPEGGEENFDEAIAAVLKAVSVPELPPPLREVFEFDRSETTGMNESFWAIADGVREFYDKHGQLPVPGGLPDMKAKSDVYIRLQNIYKAKARADAAEVLALTRSRDAGSAVTPDEVELFCKNAAFVKLVGKRSGDVAQLQKLAELEFANDEIAEAAHMPLSLIPIYLALCATSHKPPAIVEEMLAAIEALVPGAGGRKSVQDAAQEVYRAGGGELHNTSAATGGMVAQEIIKIVTKQYVPVDNTCIYDAIGSRCQVFRL